ncbi:MAG TPA: RNA 2'-phosphotransferase [Chitinophagaceae bacterium]|nr:RNA 2'-phosphotransferase [Chitinophagaceae bacterium]
MKGTNPITKSKFLSLVLRHKPQTIGLTVDANGWADTEELLQKLSTHKHSLSFEELKQLVAANDKKRFAFSPDFSKIRANQGHSLSVDLGLKVQTPPDVLYHGTAENNVDAILKEGLIKGKRHHVHLSIDPHIAKAVGSRYGKPVVITINAKQMHADGHRFYKSENDVWLTDIVLPQYFLTLNNP